MTRPTGSSAPEGASDPFRFGTPSNIHEQEHAASRAAARDAQLRGAREAVIQAAKRWGREGLGHEGFDPAEYDLSNAIDTLNALEATDA